MNARSTYVCLIQGCNLVLIILGLAAVGLAGSQFSDVSIQNYKLLDLRLLNWIYVLAGLVGVCCIARNNGVAVAKVLYCVIIVIGISTTIFYGFTTYRIVQYYREYRVLSGVPKVEAQFGPGVKSFIGKIVISALMIAIPALAIVFSIIAAILIDRLAIIVQPSWRTDSAEQKRIMHDKRFNLSTIAITKLCLAMGTLSLAVFIEYERELRISLENFIKTPLDHISAMFAICSGVVDLYYLTMMPRSNINFKVATALSIIAAVWCLKTVDNGMFPLYMNDLTEYQRSHNATGLKEFEQNQIYIVAVSQGVLMGAFSLLFLICVVSAIQATECIPRDYFSTNIRISRNLSMQNRAFGFFHFFVSVGLLAIAVIGLLQKYWIGNFIGADMLWLAVLFFTTGLVSSNNATSFLTIKFLLSIVCLAVAVENMCLSISQLYHSITLPNSQASSSTYIGQIVLYSIQLGLLTIESITSLIASISFGKSIALQPIAKHRKWSGSPSFISLGILFYGIMLTGSYIVFVIGKWRFGIDNKNIQFYRIGNGPLAIAAFIVQLCSICFSQLILSAAILQIIIASLALFTISPAITNVYYFFVILTNNKQLITITNDQTLYHIAIILASVSTLACIICIISATFAVLRSLYVMSNKGESGTSTIIAPFKQSVGSLRSPIHAPHRQVLPLQQREEQSVYWSSDENPYFYQTSRRYYGQPYQIDSGFYGYALASPNYSYYMNSTMLQPDYNTYNNRMISSAAQTRIGHAFT